MLCFALQISFIRRTLERVHAATREIALRIIKTKVRVPSSWSAPPRELAIGQNALAQVLDLLLTPGCAAAQGTALPKAGQEAVLAWLAAVAGTNVPRVMGGEVLLCMFIDS